MMSKQDTYNGFALSRLVQEGSQATPHTRSVARVVADAYYADKGSVMMSVNEIILRTGLSRRTVQRSIQELRDLGEWVITRHGSRALNNFTPNIKMLEAGQARLREAVAAARAEAEAARVLTLQEQAPAATDQPELEAPAPTPEEEPPAPAFTPLGAPTSPVEAQQAPALHLVPESGLERHATPQPKVSAAQQSYMDLMSTLIAGLTGSATERQFATLFAQHNNAARVTKMMRPLDLLQETAEQRGITPLTHMQELLLALPESKSDVRSLPGWLNTFVADDPAQHLRTVSAGTAKMRDVSANLFFPKENPTAEDYLGMF